MNNFNIECINLGKKYLNKRNSVIALEGINLKINQNEMIVLKGRSGAGKSTLLNLMCGLIKPTNGKVLIGNDCVNDLSNKALSNLLLNHIGCIFQSFNLLPTYTVYENIDIALAPTGFGKKMRSGIILSCLERFNLLDKSGVLPSQISIGQQQKVAIIRTLVKNPSIIFADEPTGSVDNETAEDIIQHLVYLKREKKLTIIVATHGNELEKYADKIHFIVDGRTSN